MHLLIQMRNKQYTKDFKIQCVEAVLKGESSVLDVVSQYQISSSSHMLGNGFRCIMLIGELKDYIPKREVYMADAREEKQPLKNVRKS